MNSIKNFAYNESTAIFATPKKRGVAQLASVPAWGAGGRPFESDHPDKKGNFLN
jgi:hypothetical protein